MEAVYTDPKINDNRRLVIIDFSSFLFSSSYFNKESTDFKDYTTSLNYFLNTILEKINPDYYLLVGDVHNNFRKQLYSSYKANRKSKDDLGLMFLSDLRTYAIKELNMMVFNKLEADDILTYLNQSKLFKKYIKKHFKIVKIEIASKDKDLTQIPCTFHRIIKEGDIITTNIDASTAIYNLYHQVLTGDSVDNIKGIFGVGKAKAFKMLESIEFKLNKETYIEEYSNQLKLKTIEAYLNSNNELTEGLKDYIKQYKQIKLITTKQELDLINIEENDVINKAIECLNKYNMDNNDTEESFKHLY